MNLNAIAASLKPWILWDNASKFVRGVTLCYSLVSAAVIASELRPYLCAEDRLVVTQMYRGHCAGLLNEAQKNMIRLHISQDPSEAIELQLPRRLSRAARRSGAL